MTEKNEEDFSIYDKENEKLVEKCGGGSLLLLFQKLKKKIANLNIRSDRIEKDVSDVALDVSVIDDEIDEINEKLEEIKTALETYGVNVRWPEKKSVVEEDEEKIVENSKNSSSSSDKIWTDKTACCWTCLHCLPRYVGANCTAIWCMNKDSASTGTQVNPLSKCYMFSRSTVREYPPPKDVMENSYTYGYSKSQYSRYKELGNKSNSVKISFMGVDINTGEETCWE